LFVSEVHFFILAKLPMSGQLETLLLTYRTFFYIAAHRPIVIKGIIQ